MFDAVIRTVASSLFAQLFLQGGQLGKRRIGIQGFFLARLPPGPVVLAAVVGLPAGTAVFALTLAPVTGSVVGLASASLLVCMPALVMPVALVVIATAGPPYQDRFRLFFGFARIAAVR